ncbi:MAG: terminase large subunit [Pseudomonadota bacterium]
MSYDVWDLSCPDWEAKLKAGQTPIPYLPLFENEADAAVSYFDKLRVPDIPGQPLMSEAGGDWFRDVLRAAFGSVEPLTDEQIKRLDIAHRYIDEIFLLIPKKNGKSTYTAALGLVAMLMNRTPNIEGVIIGSSNEVANTCFRQAAGMIEADDYLRARFHIDYHQKIITDLEADPETGRPKKAKLKIKSFNPKVATGVIPAFAIIDELHVMGETRDADRVLGQITGGGVTAQSTFVIYLTTQSERIPAGVFRDKLKFARKVRDGKAEGVVKLLPVIYEFSEAVQSDQKQLWMDPKIWPQVLPNINRSVFVEKLIPKFDEARQKGPAELSRWASQHLNIEIGIALHADQWTGAKYWLKAAEPDMNLEHIIDACEVCVVGADGGGLDDLFGLAVIGRHAITSQWLHWGHAWVDRDVLKDRPKIAPRLTDFENLGQLTVVDNIEDEANPAIVDICVRLRDAGLLPEKNWLGMDRVGVDALVDNLSLRGFDLTDVQSIRQGYELNPAVTGLPLKLKNGKFLHCGQDLMAWSVGNARQTIKGGSRVIDKEVSGVAKIDPLMALFNAYRIMSFNPVAANQGSYMDQREMVVL